MENIEKIDLSDAQIVSVQLMKTDAIVKCKMWNESIISIKFNDVIAFQAFRPSAYEVGYAVVSQDSKFLHLACDKFDQNSELYYVYSFIETETNRSFLDIVAANFELES